METKGAKDHPHHGVAKIGIQELVRARSRDYRDPVFMTHTHRILRDAGHILSQTGFRPHQAMHPDVLDAQIYTLLHDLFGYSGVGEDEHCVRLLRN